MSELAPRIQEKDGDIVPPDDYVEWFKPEIADTSEYMMRGQEVMSHAVRAAQSLEAPETARPKKVDSDERLFTVRERFGFLPRAQRELSDIYDITANDLPATPGHLPVAKHLNNILQHQEKHLVEDPSKAVRAVVSRFIDYAQIARNEHAMLTLLEPIIADSNGKLDPRRLGRDWQYTPSLSRPLMSMLWTRDVGMAFRKRNGEVPSAGDYVMSNKATVEAIQTMLSSTSSDRFTNILRHTQKSQRDRFIFWTDRLKEARSHNLAKGMAQEALKKLGIE